MNLAPTALLFLLLVQDPRADRAVVVGSGGGARIEVRDPFVIRILLKLLAEIPKAPAADGAAWTVTFYAREAALGDARVPASGEGKLPALLRDLERIDPLCRELASEEEAVRVRATRALTAMGRPALEAVRRLSETAADAEVKFRATQIVRDIRETLRPRVAAIFFFGRKEKGSPAAPPQLDEWIRKAAAEQGFPLLSAVQGEWTEVPLTKGTLFPPGPPSKPGGIYVWGQVVEWTTEGSAVVDLRSSVSSWTQGKVALDAQEPRKLLRLSNQQPMDDLFLALKILE
jgi:hypothetical protein